LAFPRDYGSQGIQYTPGAVIAPATLFLFSKQTRPKDPQRLEYKPLQKYQLEKNVD